MQTTGATTAARPQPVSGVVRLTARGRAVVASLLFVMAVVGAVMVGAAAGGAFSSASAAVGETAYVSVAQGQTLWSIAAGVAAPGQDVREVIDEIMMLNSLSSADLLVGQSLVVPVG